MGYTAVSKRARLLLIGLFCLVLLGVLASWFGIGAARQHTRFESAVEAAANARGSDAERQQICATNGPLIQSGLTEFKALLDDDKLAKAYRALGDCQIALGNFDAAVEAYESVVQYKAQQARTHADLARALSKNGRHDEAIRSARLSTQLAPHIWRSHRAMGVVLSAAGRNDEAIAAFARARALAPASEHAAAERAIERLRQKTETVSPEVTQ